MKSVPVLICASLLLIMAGCTTIGEHPAGTVTFTDDCGTTMEIAAHIERVVSLAPSETEICCAVGGCPLLVGRTDYCTYPAEAAAVETVGGPRTFSVEKVIGLEPDLVLATTVTDSIRVQEIRAAGLQVVVFRLETIEDIYRNMKVLGTLLGTSDDALLLVRDLSAREAEIESASRGGEPVRVLYVLWDEPLYVAGNNTFQNDLIVRAGGVNIMSDVEGYATVSEESVVNRAPQVIIASREHTSGLARISDRLLSRPALAEVPAIKENRICEMEPDLVNRPGPRVISALEMFSRCIHA
ncbi:MAG TPA: helical backbone metal receptor [Methanoregulaceae archaeon]|nr:ABC transporter substrate-binding protein [Methanoregulaceae archaeon]MDD3091960.1 helical backbone metal receptor [Methanoregulaceae archaeon]MDD5049321.1 helical backbone metal receptor [Methanoregulaceae archaeon]HOP68012.1 helical backbone metal receptor [Methanoregulaceae archaeon]HPJ75092.1 helical backbone metal receptor [Methanoregulaceae archaeon]